MHKSVVFCFGRMNPPTTGHQLLVNKLAAFARANKSAPRVYLSHSVGKKDPLPYDKKLAFARAAFGPMVRKSNSKNIIQILKDLEKEGFTHVTMFAGSDRVPEFTNLITKYNGKEYTFEKITVKSAGERDPDADDVSGMSASKMRALAKDDKVAEFLRGAPNTLKSAQAKNMFNAVRKALLGEDVMEYGHDERFLEFILESDMKDDLSDLPSDGEIAKHFDSLGANDLDLDDADAMMLDIILGGEQDKEDIDEARVLTFQQRQKLSQRMKAVSKRLARLRQIKAKVMPTQQRLRFRARKAALMILRRRATGRKNLEYNALSRSQRIAVDTALMQRFGKNLNTLVGRLATRIMPRVRKHAQEYMKKAREGGVRSSGGVKESFFSEAKGVVNTKREKTKVDTEQHSSLDVDANKLNSLEIDPMKNDRVAPNPKQGHLYSYRGRHVYEARRGSSAETGDAGDKNIIYQMRKVIIARGNHDVVFDDGTRHKISVSDANKLIDKFNSIRIPKEKQQFTIAASKSLAKFKDILAHGLPKETKQKISLGGKQFKEFYMGAGRTRTIAPYPQHSDEPPGTRRVAEASTGGVDPDANDDPNKSRKTNQKLDLLLRLGLADGSELQKYRRALRSSKKQALQSPEMRKKLADLLDKLIDLTTGDPTTFSRVRQRVMTKEAMSLLSKAEKSGVDVDIIFEVFSRGYNNNEDINEAFSRVNSFIAGGKAVDMDSDLSEKVDLPQKYRAGLSDKTAAARKSHWDKANKLSDRDPRAYEPAPGDATAKTKLSKHTIKYKKMFGEESIDESSETGLAAKAKKSGVSIDTLRKVYRRGVAAWNSGHRPGTTPQQWGMARVNSYITKGKGTYHGADKDLRSEEVVDEACWDTHKQVGMKKKGNRMVPNCVPKEDTEAKVTVDEMQRTADIKMIKVRMPDGTMKFRKERTTTSVQNELYTGSEPTSSNKNDPANRFVGTDEIRKNYASATPGQEQVAGEISVAAFSPEKQSYISPGVRRAANEVDQSKQEAGQKTLKSFREALSGIRESNDLNEAFSAGFELAPLARDYGIKVQSAFEHHPEVQESLDAKKIVANETVEEDKKGHKSPSGGLTQKGRDYYNRQSGGNLKAPVTTEPSKLKKGSKSANRRKSFCARMGGMKKRLTSAKTANDPDSRINKALRKWNC